MVETWGLGQDTAEGIAEEIAEGTEGRAAAKIAVEGTAVQETCQESTVVADMEFDQA